MANLLLTAKQGLNCIVLAKRPARSLEKTLKTYRSQLDQAGQTDLSQFLLFLNQAFKLKPTDLKPLKYPYQKDIPENPANSKEAEKKQSSLLKTQEKQRNLAHLYNNLYRNAILSRLNLEDGALNKIKDPELKKFLSTWIGKLQHNQGDLWFGIANTLRLRGIDNYRIGAFLKRDFQPIDPENLINISSIIEQIKKLPKEYLDSIVDNSSLEIMLQLDWSKFIYFLEALPFDEETKKKVHSEISKNISFEERNLSEHITPETLIKFLLKNLSDQERKSPRILLASLLLDLFKENFVHFLSSIRRISDINAIKILKSLNRINLNTIDAQYLSRIQSYLPNLVDNQQVIKPTNDHHLYRTLYPFDQDYLKQLSSEIIADSPPFKVGDPAFLQTQNQAIRIANAAHDTHLGFTSSKCDLMHLPSSHDSISLEFGEACFGKLKRLNRSDISKYPGSGLSFEQIKLPVVLGFGDIDENELDSAPVEQFNAQLENLKNNSLSWLKESFAEVKDAKFYTTRGFIAVTPPKSQKYFIKGRLGEPVHYSYIVFNEHFRDSQKDAVSFLVPTETLERLMTPYEVNSQDYTGYRPDLPDFSNSDLNLEKFRSETDFDNADILNLSWASNLAGLANSFPPRSYPYHLWERARNSETKDSFGHVHKTHILGSYIPTITDKLGRAWEPLKEAHNSVYAASLGCQKLLDIFKLSMSCWHKGISNTNKPDNESEITFDLEDLDFTNERYKYMLNKAYSWHQELSEGHADKNKYPVLLIANTFKLSEMPNLDLYLDTLDMSININQNGSLVKIPLHSNQVDEATELRFKKYFIENVLLDPSKDLRFYPRELLNANQPN